MQEENVRKDDLDQENFSENASFNADTPLADTVDADDAKEDRDTVLISNDMSDKPRAEEMSIDEYKKVLDGHFQNLRALIRYTKTKDETIYKLSGELQKYREGYYTKTFKTIAALLISHREDCRKSLFDLENFDLTLDKAKKYISFLCDEYKELLSNIGCEETEGVWSFNGKPLEDAKGEVPGFPKQFEIEIEKMGQEDSEIEINGNNLGEYLVKTEEAIKCMLADNEMQDKCLKEYCALSAAIENDFILLRVYPSVRKLISLFNKIKQRAEEYQENLNEETMRGAYSDCLNFLVEEIEEVLLSIDVRIDTTENEMFDAKRNRLVRAVITDDASLDRKIIKRHTECYTLDNVVIYPAKVDVYKFQTA